MANPATGKPPVEIVPILRDELLSGYRGRLGNAYNCSRTVEVHALMRAAYPVADFDGQAHFVVNVAKALKVQARALIFEHTVWPIFAALPERDASSEADRSPYSPGFSHLWMKSARQHLAMCPVCVAADLSNPALYISYWRRSHQVPGVMHCPEHGEALLFVAPPNRFGAFPHELLAVGRKASDAVLGFAARSAVALRTIDLMFQTLGTRALKPRQLVIGALARQAYKATGRSSITEVQTALAGMVLSQVSAEWLHDLLPHYKGAKTGIPAFLQAALSGQSRSLSAPAAAFVAALLFDSTNEAAEALLCDRTEPGLRLAV